MIEFVLRVVPSATTGVSKKLHLFLMTLEGEEERNNKPASDQDLRTFDTVE